ncbi:MAG: HNH endonuclease [Acidimicrobiia bacterium]
MILDLESDHELRSSAFAFLRAAQLRTGGPVRLGDVSTFEFRGERISLLDPQRGIRSPRQLETALSFRTRFADRPEARPYDDSPGPDGYLRYKWRGTNPAQAENRAMRRSLELGLPMIWFQGIASGLYLPIFPVWALEEEPSACQFVIALDELQIERWKRAESDVTPLDRTYADEIARRRLHQPVFRARVLDAYGSRCSICRLRHNELLDAAHIRSDADGGQPVVPNGLALCKIHHAAFDAELLGISPDYEVVIRPDVLGETDGPTLRHALQGMHETLIAVPKKKAAQPDRELLAERFDSFRKAG